MLTYALLVYDERQPVLRKFLRDQDFWEELNAISGPNLLVFAARDKAISGDESGQTSLDIVVGTQFRSNDRTVPYSGMLQQLAREQVNVQYPFLVFFQSKGGEVSDYLIVPLLKPRPEDSIEKLRRTVKIVAESLSLVHEENYGNRDVIVRNVRESLDSQDILNLMLASATTAVALIGKPRVWTSLFESLRSHSF